jgi:1,4-dihydroxy-2-naphthoate octaprenyltransferase
MDAQRPRLVPRIVTEGRSVAYLILVRFFTPVLLIVLVALRSFAHVWPIFRQPKPAEKPANFPDVWPNYFVAAAFVHNREFGLFYMFSLILNAIPTVWILR